MTTLEKALDQASEIAKTLGVSEGTMDTFVFPEPVNIVKKKRGMPVAYYTLTHAVIAKRVGWAQIIVKGTRKSNNSVLPIRLRWDEFLVSERHLLENALLKSNA